MSPTQPPPVSRPDWLELSRAGYSVEFYPRGAVGGLWATFLRGQLLAHGTAATRADAYTAGRTCAALHMRAVRAALARTE